MDIYQIRAILPFITVFLSLILTLILWFKGKSKVSFYLGWAALFTSIQSFAFGARFFFEHNRIFWIRLTGGTGVLLVASFVVFVYSFSGKTKYFRLKVFFWYLLAGIIFFLAVATSYIYAGVGSEYPYLKQPGSLDLLMRLYILVGVIVAWFHLLRNYFKTKGFRKLQLKYFILGIGIYSIVGFLTSGIIPLFYPEFSYTELTSASAAPGIALITYAIFKRRLFAIKIILTEMLVSIIGVILLIQTVLAETVATRIFALITFFAFLLAGYLLIKITQKEIRRKEQAEKLTQELEELNETLEDKVKERTRELRERVDELESFHKVTIGRELKMLELKNKIKKLEKQLEKYDKRS